MSVRLILPVFAALVLSACATITTYHNECLETYAAFADQVACTQAQVQADQRLRGDPLVQEYLLTANQLVGEVERGEASEEEARLDLVRTLNRIRERDLQMRAAEAEIHRIHDRRWPAFTDCYRDAGSVRCITY